MGRRMLIFLVVLNTFATLGALVFATYQYLSWEFGLAISNKSGEGSILIDDVLKNVEGLFLAIVTPLAATSGAWFVLTCIALAQGRNCRRN